MMGLNKKGASDFTWSKFFAVVIGALVVVIVLMFAIGFPSWITDRIPDFIGGEVKIIERPDENKDIPYFEFRDGTTASNLLYAYVKGVGWKWSDSVGWYGVDETNKPEFKRLSEKNKDFIFELQEKPCAEGIRWLVRRDLKNEEGGWLPKFAGGGADILIHYKKKVTEFDYKSDSQIDDLCKIIEGEIE